MNTLVLYFGQDDPATQYAYEILCGTTALERAVLIGSRAYQVQRIYVLVPLSHKHRVNGSSLQPPLIDKAKWAGLKKIECEFYQESVGRTRALYELALKWGLSDLVVMNGNSFLMPSWFVDDCFYDYRVRSGSGEGDFSVKDSYFSLESFSFSRLARISSEDSTSDPRLVDPPIQSDVPLYFSPANKAFLEQVISEMDAGLGLLDILELYDK